MKYTLIINQKGWTELCPEADFRHAYILEAIKSMCNSKSNKMIRTEDGFTWISHSKILDELPMSMIKSKSGLTPIIKKLHEWKMIELYRDNQDGKQYYKMTIKAEQLERDVNTCSSEQTPRSPQRTPPVHHSERPRSSQRTYHCTSDPNTIDPYTSDPPKKPQEPIKKVIAKDLYNKLLKYFPEAPDEICEGHQEALINAIKYFGENKIILAAKNTYDYNQEHSDYKRGLDWFLKGYGEKWKYNISKMIKYKKQKEDVVESWLNNDKHDEMRQQREKELYEDYLE